MVATIRQVGHFSAHNNLQVRYTIITVLHVGCRDGLIPLDSVSKLRVSHFVIGANTINPRTMSRKVFSLEHLPVTPRMP